MQTQSSPERAAPVCELTWALLHWFIGLCFLSVLCFLWFLHSFHLLFHGFSSSSQDSGPILLTSLPPIVFTYKFCLVTSQYLVLLPLLGHINALSRQRCQAQSVGCASVIENSLRSWDARASSFIFPSLSNSIPPTSDHHPPSIIHKFFFNN